MIKTQNLIPEIYYKESRDFQLLGRIYDIIYNYAKTNVDLVLDNDESYLLDLLVRTLGFYPTHNYDTKNLKAIASIYSELIRCKGSKKAIEILVNTILRANDIEAKAEIISNEGVVEIYLYLDQTSTEIVLIEELLDYILPVNQTYQIITSISEKFPTQYLYFDQVLTSGNINKEDSSAIANTTSTTINIFNPVTISGTTLSQTISPAPVKGKTTLGAVAENIEDSEA